MLLNLLINLKIFWKLIRRRLSSETSQRRQAKAGEAEVGVEGEGVGSQVKPLLRLN